MTQEIIEKEIDARLDEPDNNFGGIFNSGYSQGFRNGAHWRIASVWHDASEKPEVGKQIIVETLVIDDKKKYDLWTQEENDNWEHDVHYFDVKRWAYIADLLPEGKED